MGVAKWLLMLGKIYLKVETFVRDLQRATKILETLQTDSYVNTIVYFKE